MPSERTTGEAVVESALTGLNRLHQLGRIAGMQEAVQILQDARMRDAASIVLEHYRKIMQEMDK